MRGGVFLNISRYTGAPVGPFTTSPLYVYEQVAVNLVGRPGLISTGSWSGHAVFPPNWGEPQTARPSSALQSSIRVTSIFKE